MVNHPRARNIAGFCVGEPWSGHAVHDGLGRILITGYEIWNNTWMKAIHSAACYVSSLLTRTLSIRVPSRSSTSNRNPSQSKWSPAAGIASKPASMKPARVS